MPYGFENATDTQLHDQLASLVREADEAFDADEKAACIEAIVRLFELYDEKLASTGPPLAFTDA